MDELVASGDMDLEHSPLSRAKHPGLSRAGPGDTDRERVLARDALTRFRRDRGCVNSAERLLGLGA